jgi:outer membrane protein assembly factor BamD
MKRVMPWLLFAMVVPVLFQGCLFFGGRSGKYTQKELVMDANYYFDRGMKELKKRQYARAVENFNTVIESFSGSAVVDSALYYLAESHFKNEDYLTAAYEYERVYADYPASKFVAEAQYKKALSYSMESPKATLDQENTRLAIDEFTRFIENYPANPLVAEAQKRIDELTEKLAYKDYLIAELYRKMNSKESLGAALIYFQSVMKDYPRSTWAWYSQYGIGVVQRKLKEIDAAKESFAVLVRSDKTPPDIKKKAQRELKELGKNGK